MLDDHVLSIGARSKSYMCRRSLFDEAERRGSFFSRPAASSTRHRGGRSTTEWDRTNPPNRLSATTTNAGYSQLGKTLFGLLTATRSGATGRESAMAAPI